MVGAVKEQEYQQLSQETFLSQALSLPGTIQLFDVSASPLYQRDESIYLKDQAPADIYVVLEGIAKLWDEPHIDKRVIYDFRGRGEIFGDTLKHGRYLECAGSVGFTKVKRIDRSVFIDYGLGEYLDLSNREFDWRQREMRNDLAAGVPATLRVSRALLRLSRRFGAPSKSQHDPGRVFLPFRHDDMASYISASRETVTKTFREMRNAGVITSGQGSMSFHPTVMKDYIELLEDSLV